MRIKSRRGLASRAAILVAAAFALAAFASISSSSAAPPGQAPDATVFIRDGRTPGQLRFVAPDTVQAGDALRVVNKTNPRRVGPHTFSLVTRGSLPKTRAARRACFAPGHICRAIAKWHGSNGNTPPSINPAEAGRPGWDTLGSKTRKGDSWFTGNRPDAAITQDVSIQQADTPTRIFFMCAIHPWMKGSIKVLPRGGGA